MVRDYSGTRTGIVCGWLALVGFSFLLTFGPVFYGAVEEWQVSVLVFASILVFLSWSVSNLASRKPEVSSRAFPKTSLAVYGLPVLFTLVVVLQVIPLPSSVLGAVSPARAALNKVAGIEGNTSVSAAPHTTTLWLFRVIAFSAVFIVASQAFTRRKQVLYLLALIVVLGYLNAVYGILQYLSDDSLPCLFARKYHFGRAAGTYYNANHFAGYLEMCTPLALAVVFIGKRRTSGAGLRLSQRVADFLSERLQDRKFLLPLTAVVVMSLAIVFSMSRMGIFAFVFSLVLFGLLIGGRHARRLRLTILGSVVGVILGVSLWLGLDPVLRRYSLLIEGAVRRAEAWEMTTEVIRDYPALGTGLGTFTRVSPVYQTELTKRGHWAESHNDYLNLMSDTGIVGFAIAMCFLLAWYIYVFRLLSRKHLRTYQRVIAVGCIAGVSAIVVHSIADFNLQIPANAVYFAALLGLGIAVLRIRELPISGPGAGRQSDEGEVQVAKASPTMRGAPGRVAVLTVAVLLAIIVLPLTVRRALSVSWLEHSKTLKSTESRIQALNKSISLDFGNPESHYQLGKVEYRDKKDYKQARDRFMTAVRLAPYNGRYHWRLGTALARLGDDRPSEKEISLAKQLSPFDGDLHYKIGFNHFYKWLRTGSAESFTDAMAEFRKAAEIEIVYLSSSLELVAKYLPQHENLKNVVPATVAHRRSFANYLAGRGRWSEALIEYRNTWRLIMKEDQSYRGDEYLVLALARCYLMTGNVQDAKRGYRKALDITREKRKVFRAVRHNFARAKQPHEGLSLLQSFKEEFPHDNFLDLEIAKAHLAAGEYDAAEELFLELSDLRPSEEVYRHLFNLAMRGREFDLAEIHANYAIRLNRGEASYYAMLARAREANKDYKGAAQALKHALSIEPQNKLFKEQLDRVGERLLLEKKK